MALAGPGLSLSSSVTWEHSWEDPGGALGAVVVLMPVNLGPQGLAGALASRAAVFWKPPLPLRHALDPPVSSTLPTTPSNTPKSAWGLLWV